MNFRLILSIFSILSFTVVKPYIHEIDVYENITCFGDVHYGSIPWLEHPTLKNEEIAQINKDHTKIFLDIIKKSDNSNSVILVEDMFDYSKDKDYNNFFINVWNTNLEKNYTNCLTFINQHCKNNNTNVINIEFRQPFFQFFSRTNITSDVFLNHLDDLINEIRNYNDTYDLNKYYQESIDNILKKDFLKILKENKDKILTDFLYQDKSYYSLMNDFLDNYHDLFDVRLLHNIYQLDKQNKKIFVIVGNLHIKNLRKNLEDFGYDKHLKHISSLDPKKPIDFGVIAKDLFNIKIDNPKTIELLFNFILLIFIFSITGIIKEFSYYMKRQYNQPNLLI